MNRTITTAPPAGRPSRTRRRRRSLDDGPALSVLTVLSPLREPAAEVTARLEALPDPSPFAVSERTHFARLLVLQAARPAQLRPNGMRFGARVLDLVTHLGRQPADDELPGPYLLFAAAYDPDDDGAAGYVEHLRSRLGDAADAIWAGCSGYPADGRRDAEGFAAFLAAGRMPAGYVFTPPDRATVAQVRDALEARRRVVGLATTTGDDPAALRSGYLARFDASGEPAVDGPAAVLPAVAEDEGETQAWNDLTADALDYGLRRRRPGRRGLRRSDLRDVQGVVVGYRTHRAAAFAFLEVVDPGRARDWLAALRLASVADARGEQVPPAATHVAFTHAGLRRLDVPAEDLAGFDRSFRAGMAAREPALAPRTGTSSWDPEFRDGSVDILLHVSATDRDEVDRTLGRLREGLPSGGLRELFVQAAGRIVPPGAAPDAFVEHFGFRDGISQPRIPGLTSRTERDDTTLPPGEVLLGYADVDGDTAGDVAPPWLALNGSYLVLRKLEQDVPAFRAMTARAADGAGSDGAGSDGAAAVAAKLVGRHADGSPLRAPDDPAHALAAAPGPEGLAHLSFRDDPEGSVCPVGSHVRRVNPRDSAPLQASADGDGLEGRLHRRHRMLRRGIPYGPPLPAGATEDTTPDGGRGLVFAALVGDIGRQFEFVQTQWMNDGNALRLGTDPDVFAGVAGDGLKATIQGCPPRFVQLPAPVVTCRGGEYFFVPGIAALRRLAGLQARGFAARRRLVTYRRVVPR